VIAIGNEGRHQLDILRKIATGPDSFWSNNHTLPMIEEIQLEDIVLGVFPKVGGGMFEAFSFWPKNSVGDGLEMVMQMLEVSYSAFYLHSARPILCIGSGVYSQIEYSPSST